jgi:hypothetical protein
MKNKRLIILVLFLSLFSLRVQAEDLCSKNGYTILTINGIFTNKEDAAENKRNLEVKLPQSYNNQTVKVDFVHNPTHFGGIGDLVDVVRQGLFDPKSDYDLVEMLDGASGKVDTQKLLIVGHSQGNFYANNFYDKVVDKDGGVPAQSIGVYGVATPDKRVAGDGKYLTSDTDQVIATVAGRLKKIMTPNTHIELKKEDGYGHDFSDVYLKYRSSEIISDIKSSLDKLETNNIQSETGFCLTPKKISLNHKITGAIISTGDFIVNNTIKVAIDTYKKIDSKVDSLAHTILNLSKRSLALVGASGDEDNKENIDIPVESNNDSSVDNLLSEIPISQNEIEVKPKDNLTISNQENLPDDTNQSIQNIPVIGGGYVGSHKDKIVAPIATSPEIVDTIPPIISLVGGSIITINLNTNYVDSGATATDNFDKIIDVLSTGTVETSKIGVCTISYTAKDLAGNFAIPITRTINVVDNLNDTTPPVISLNGENEINIELNESYSESGATAFDNKDGEVDVVISGTVDTTNIGTYEITYTAQDKSLNTKVLIRKVTIINSNPVVSNTTQILLPTSGIYKDSGINQNSGRSNITPFNFQIVFSDSNNNPPNDIKLHVKDKNTGNYLPDISLNKIELGSDILSDGDYMNGEIYTISGIYDTGDYMYSFTAYDKNGNYSKIEEKDILKFSAFPSSFIYNPKYTFGSNNGDGKDWQVWVFNGSYIYDWTDVYVNKYLREQFKIKANTGYVFCGDCLERGIFNHDPKKGFEMSEFYISSLENNPQNDHSGITYDVVIQWDSSGYTYTIFHGDVVDFTSHINVPDMNNNLWVGWDGSAGGFQKFPSGGWYGVTPNSPEGKAGGSGMIITPYPVYDALAEETIPSPIPTVPVVVKSSEKLIKSFNIENLNPNIIGVIDDINNKINLTVPYGTNITNIVPTISISDKASVAPSNQLAQNFTNTILYTVTAEDLSTKTYEVKVTIATDPNQQQGDDDSLLPNITSYTLNGEQGNITLNPKVNNLSIILNANKNVNWKTIKIENESDSTLDKLFQSGDGCNDGSKICMKIWKGEFPGDRLLLNGNYKIKVHMVDSLLHDYDKYLDSIITVIGQSI